MLVGPPQARCEMWALDRPKRQGMVRHSDSLDTNFDGSTHKKSIRWRSFVDKWKWLDDTLFPSPDVLSKASLVVPHVELHKCRVEVIVPVCR